MKKPIIIHSGHGDTKISIEKDAFLTLKKHLAEKHAGVRVAVITDTTVAKLFKEKIKKNLPDVSLIVVKPGEKSKSMKMAEALCKKLLRAGFKRDSVVIALGGGMITDLAGFVASIYMRGIVFIALPTTLLAMIDASVGGKTSINLEAKNVIGTFHPAERILIDLGFLKSLSEREMKIGVAEVIKYAAVLDASLEKTLMQKKINFPDILEKGLRVKADVCNKDLKEKGPRKVLNFGHTFGHAIEYLSHYKLSHGEAISIGMSLANRIAQNLGKQKKADGNKISAMLKHYELPTELPKNIKMKDVIQMVFRDKKMMEDGIDYIISKGMGTYEIVKMKPEELMKLLK